MTKSLLFDWQHKYLGKRWFEEDLPSLLASHDPKGWVGESMILASQALNELYPSKKELERQGGYER